MLNLERTELILLHPVRINRNLKKYKSIKQRIAETDNRGEYIYMGMVDLIGLNEISKICLSVGYTPSYTLKKLFQNFDTVFGNQLGDVIEGFYIHRVKTGELTADKKFMVFKDVGYIFN